MQLLPDLHGDDDVAKASMDDVQTFYFMSIFSFKIQSDGLEKIMNVLRGYYGSKFRVGEGIDGKDVLFTVNVMSECI